jgi:hypothetical protein
MSSSDRVFREGLLYMEERRRRLYCLQCYQGALTTLPSEIFVKTHIERHEFPKDAVDSMFLVVERGSDKSIRLDDKLDALLANPNLVWKGWEVVTVPAKEDEDE